MSDIIHDGTRRKFNDITVHNVDLPIHYNAHDVRLSNTQCVLILEPVGRSTLDWLQ